MSAEKYYERITEILAKIESTQLDAIRKAAAVMAESIAKKNRVYIFGSGHSVIPVMDIFPRYGSYVGWFPLYDPRLMWHNVVGPGGARELLWLERQEGYIKNFLMSYSLEKGDCMLVFSHGGLNAAPIEMALEAKAKGLTVVTASSHANKAIAKITHSSGKTLSDVADIAIDNCVPPEDALVNIGKLENVGAGSTMAFVFIAMSLVSETGARLAAAGVDPITFVSPNVHGVTKDHNMQVFEHHTAALFSRNPAKIG